MVNLEGTQLKSERPTVSDDIVRKHIKVIGNKVLLRVLRKKYSGIVIADEKRMEFEPYFPVIAVGASVLNIFPGDYAGLEPGGKWGITTFFGEEFLIVDPYRIDHIVTPEYAKMHADYQTTEDNDIFRLAEEAKKESASLLAKNGEDVKTNVAIMGDWSTKSKPN